MKKSVSKNFGGKRPGAGRPKLKIPRVTVTVRVPETKQVELKEFVKKLQEET